MPVRDGYDVIDKRVAVVTSNTNPVVHALFMPTFTPHVTLFERTPETLLDESTRARLAQAEVDVVASPLLGVTLSERMTPVLHTEDGADHEFDVLYPMLGETARSDLAVALGADTADCMELWSTRTSRPACPACTPSATSCAA